MRSIAFVAVAWGLVLFVAAEPCLGQQAVRRAGETRDAKAEERRQRALSRLLMSRSRNLAAVENDEMAIVLHTGKVAQEHADYAGLSSLAPGDIHRLTSAAATKLTTDRTLRFSDGTLEPGNVSEGFRGVYSVWLKRSGSDGWSLVFNGESDVWGTQRDPAMDVEEIALAHAEADEAASELTPQLEVQEGRGTLELQWGVHRWTATFSVE